jgi:hypothetical protein
MSDTKVWWGHSYRFQLCRNSFKKCRNNLKTLKIKYLERGF